MLSMKKQKSLHRIIKTKVVKKQTASKHLTVIFTLLAKKTKNSFNSKNIVIFAPGFSDFFYYSGLALEVIYI